MEGNINDGRRQIDEQIRQCRGYPQKKHVIQQPIPTLRNLIQPPKKTKFHINNTQQIQNIDIIKGGTRTNLSLEEP